MFPSFQGILAAVLHAQLQTATKLDAVLAELHSPRATSLTNASTLTSATASAIAQVDAVPSVGLMTFITQGLKIMVNRNPLLISAGQHGVKRKTDEGEADPHYSGSQSQCALNLVRQVCGRPGSHVTFAQVIAGPAPAGGVIIYIRTICHIFLINDMFVYTSTLVENSCQCSCF